MKVAIYKDTLANRRGADVAVAGLADGLRERGHEAVLFEKDELARRMGEKWDVFVSAGTNELLDIAAAFPRAFPWPVLQQFHTDPKGQFKRKRIIRNWKIRRALGRVSAIQVLREEFVPQVGAYGPRVEVIGNWSAYEGVTPASAGSCAESRTVVYPGAFCKGKNQRLAVEAFAALADEFPGWTLELYGSGAFDAPLPPNVRLMGYRDLRDVYPRCAFVAFPSIDEGFGLVLADAAMFSRPAVMVRDWIGTASAGGGIAAGASVDSFALGLRSLMSDPGMRTEMGRAARSFCLGAYSRRVILDRWESALRAVRQSSGQVQ